MQKAKSVLWGLLLIAVGVIAATNVLGLTDIEIFFDGWWTLFIIVPCAFGLLEHQDRTGNLIGLGIGVALLLGCQGLLDFALLWKLLLPAVLIVLGLSLVFRNVVGSNISRKIKETTAKQGHFETYCAAFSGQRLNYAGKNFHGADVTAVFGGVKVDLTGAVLSGDVVVRACAVFGGVDIIVPSQYRVETRSSSLFGGVSHVNNQSRNPDGYTVYVDASCLFGGVAIK